MKMGRKKYAYFIHICGSLVNAVCTLATLTSYKKLQGGGKSIAQAFR